MNHSDYLQGMLEKVKFYIPLDLSIEASDIFVFHVPAFSLSTKVLCFTFCFSPTSYIGVKAEVEKNSLGSALESHIS